MGRWLNIEKTMAASHLPAELQRPRRWRLGKQREEDEAEWVRMETVLFKVALACVPS